MDNISKIYADKMFPCEKPCDSYGICEGCSERNIYEAGYNMAIKSQADELQALNLENARLREALKFYACELDSEFNSSHIDADLYEYDFDRDIPVFTGGKRARAALNPALGKAGA